MVNHPATRSFFDAISLTEGAPKSAGWPAMKIDYWTAFALAVIGLTPMATVPLFGPVIKHSAHESVVFGTLIIGMLSAGWFFRISQR